MKQPKGFVQTFIGLWVCETLIPTGYVVSFSLKSKQTKVPMNSFRLAGTAPTVICAGTLVVVKIQWNASLRPVSPCLPMNCVWQVHRAQIKGVFSSRLVC